MTLLGKETFLFFLGLSASVSGRRDDRPICLARGNSNNKGLPEDVSVDCDNVPPSLDNITMYLTDGDSFNGTVFSNSSDADAYDEAVLQYASAKLSVTTKPSYIVEAMNEVDVQATVTFAAHCGLKVTTRSGGHSFVGSSSCDGDEAACIQLDVGNIAHINVFEIDDDGNKQVNVGPGTRLGDLYPELMANGIYMPAGECSDIGIGGHMQTGGIGPWMRSFGYFSHYVASFKIVLADGSLVSVSPPQEKLTSKLNDDLWYAVIGGASGSYGTLVDITLNSVNENDYFAFYWEVNFFHDDSTVDCIKNMLREYATMLEDDTLNKNDPRWNVWLLVAGFKTLLSQSLGSLAFNYFQLDFTWVVPTDSGQTKEQVFDEAKAIYDRLLGAFERDGDNCITLDQYFEALPVPGDTKTALKGRFLSTYATVDDERTLSQLNNDVTLFDWDALGLQENGIPFKSSYQQGPQFPNKDDLVEIFDRIDASVPRDPATEPVVVISQIVTLAGPLKSKRAIALPFQDDVMGVSFDMWNLYPPKPVDFGPTLREVQDLVISALGEEDHRMFWAAYGDTCLECGAWEKYYESRPKYNELSRIKRCIDPDNIFKYRMSMPTNPLKEEL